MKFVVLPKHASVVSVVIVPAEPMLSILDRCYERMWIARAKKVAA